MTKEISVMCDMEKARLEQELSVLRQELLVARCDQRDLFFAQLLGGAHFYTEQDLLDEGGRVGVDFPYRNFVVLSAKPEAWGELFGHGGMDRRDLNFILRNMLENGFPGKTHAADVQGRMVAILNLETLPEMGVRGLVQDARHLLEVLEREFGITITVAISRVCHSPLELPHAMGDVNLIFEYLQLMGEDAPITTYEELRHPNMPNSPTSFLDLETRLLGCIRAADFSGMRMVMHELINNEFGETRPTVDTFRFRIYGVVNTLLYLLSDIRSVVGHELINELDPGPRLTSAGTLDEIVTVMDDIMTELEVRTSHRRQPAVPGWVEKVRDYVDENFRDPDVTISYIADKFSLTPTYCSKIYREQYNVRLFDYIQQKRLEAAKELMKTEMSLREIADAAGFSNGLTMSRAFKRYEGTTPNKLREQIRR